jgi:hypothetical protein
MSGEGSPTSWVVSQNIHRRHLSESQRAQIAAALTEMFAAEAKERQRAAGGAHPEPVSANLREAAGKATEKAAAAMNVSPRLVESALKVQRSGVPELAEAVKAPWATMGQCPTVPPPGAIVILPDGTVCRAGRDGELVPVVLGGHPHGEMGTGPVATRRPVRSDIIIQNDVTGRAPAGTA